MLQRQLRGFTGRKHMRRRHPLVVVITGATSGVGRATAIAFAKRGASIGLLARGRDGLAGTVRDVRRLGAKPLAVPTDVADPEQVEAAAARVEEELGPIDVWVNNAMTSVFSPVIQMKAEEYQRVTAVTYLGGVNGTLAALRRMLPRDRGLIIQVGSALAYRAIPLQSAYCAAKHALQGFSESLRTELMHDGSGVRVTMVHLPAMNTPQFRHCKSRMPRKAQPVPPIYQPEIAAEAIVWSVRHKRRALFVGWPTVKAVYGNRIAPSIIDRVLAKNGFDSQQYDGADDSSRPNNLWEPVPGDPGPHGEFGSRSRNMSWQLLLDMNRRWLAPALLGLAAGVKVGGLICSHSSRGK